MIELPEGVKFTELKEEELRELIAQEIWFAAMDKCKKERVNPAERNDLFFGCKIARKGYP